MGKETMRMRKWIALLLCLLLCGCSQPEELPWWYAPVHAESLQKHDLDGDGVTVAVLDSGIDADHPWFRKTDLVLTEPYADSVGHGTFVTGLLTSLMPKATYLPIQIAGSNDISIPRIVAGLEAAMEAEADVAVLSLGLTEDVPELQEAVEALADTGCLIFAAVGNDGTDTLYYPAAYDCVIGVGSCNLALNPSETSQYNESVFLLAPGVKITGPWKNGGQETLKGTSYAVPFAAAAGIAIKAAGVEDCLQVLRDSVVDWGETGYDVESGWGVLDYEKLCQILCE